MLLMSSLETTTNFFFEDVYYRKRKQLEDFNGYIYIYTHFIDQKRTLYKTIKKISRVKIISFADKIDKCLSNENLKFIHSKPFPFIKNGFNSNYLRIRLSNIPLYTSESDYESFIPDLISKINLGYINPDDFLNWRKERVKILFDNSFNNHHHHEYYINFDDIHVIKADLYIDDQLKLAKIKNKTLENVDTINKNVKNHMEKKDKNFINKNIHSLFTEKKILSSLEVVAFAYSYSMFLKQKRFFAYNTQIFTAYEAIKQFIKPRWKKQKGLIFQVETGEGKSCIVCLIAAALAKLGKTVHITSSNIKLSIRDYEDSFDYFSLLKIKSALLVHQNELPASIKNKFKSEPSSERINYELKKKQAMFNMDKIANVININNNNDEAESFDEFRNLHKIEEDEFFKFNEDNYYKYHSNAVDSALDKCYPSEYYHPDLFKNTSRMNYSVCGLTEQGTDSKNKAQVIFSTFVNFECFYLKMVEKCPASVESEFAKYSLLIDEADYVLIDEIANGTIVARSMNSNAKEILKYVYDEYKKGTSYQKVWHYIVKEEPKWAICKDITIPHVKQMYDDIKMVCENPEYTNGKLYSVQDIIVKNAKKKNKYLKKILDVAKDIGKDIVKGLIKEFTKDPNAEDDGNDNDDDDSDDSDDDDSDYEDDKNESDSPTTIFKHIVPFGYQHNGMLEPNKQFGRFIQQFIAIKESEVHPNMIIDDISMSYLYVSHPIFVKLYGTVCGFTGTVGDKSDKKIYKKQYNLNTLKVPRHSPNKRVEFPTIYCKDKKERNQRIVSEVVEFHKRGNPVLVIFQDLNEIDEVEAMLHSKKINFINIFDGKNDSIKPDEIAGIKGAVSLGTNSCGRGTDIKAKGLPIHVILSYYSTNTRVMNQAFGRTARQGRFGTCRLICEISQFFMPTYILSDTKDMMNEFYIKNRRQQEFVDHYKMKLKWLFTNFPDFSKSKYLLKNKFIKELRETKINCNRIVAYKYKFPICMNQETFITIQLQKIFSLFNCPDSEFTWKLFQRYFRELILESWSLLINEIDQDFINKEKNSSFDAKIVEKRKLLYESLDKFIPMVENDMASTFIHIFKNSKN